jgi:DNA-binding CsgD family transcriptional regulator
MRFSDYSYSYSSILPDYYLISYQLTMAVLSEYPEPSAFVGYNNDSFADKDRLNGFKKAAEESGVEFEIYPNDHGIQHCLDNIMTDIGKYKNIICISDVVAVPLINALKKKGINPADFNIASLRSMKIGEFNKPSITSVTSDYHSEGMTAVDAYMLLLKKRYIQNLFIHTESRILFRESTHLKKNNIKFFPGQELNGPMVDFYGDDIVKEIDIMEKMLINCDNIDINIIRCIIKGYTYEEISDFNSLAVNTVKYRINKIVKSLNVNNRKEFIEYLMKFDLSF